MTGRSTTTEHARQLTVYFSAYLFVLLGRSPASTAGVALSAAMLMTAVNALRHHRPLELVVQIALLAVISMVAYRLVDRHRLRASPQRDGPSLPGQDGNGPSVRARRE